MKKLITLLSAVGIVSTGVSQVIACGTDDIKTNETQTLYLKGEYKDEKGETTPYDYTVDKIKGEDLINLVFNIFDNTKVNVFATDSLNSFKEKHNLASDWESTNEIAYTEFIGIGSETDSQNGDDDDSTPDWHSETFNLKDAKGVILKEDFDGDKKWDFTYRIDFKWGNEKTN